MAFIAPFGNYLAGKSLLYRLDARFKLLLLVSYLTGLFLVQSWLGLLCFGMLLLAAYLSAGIPLKLALRGLMPLVIILIFTMLANAFGFVSDTNQTLGFVSLIGDFGFKPWGALRGLYLALRIILLFCASSLLTYTSSLVALADALVSLLRPLAVFGVPTEDIAMVFSIALRFIFLTANEAERIMIAQQARGAVFDKGGPVKRAKAWLPVLIPLFVKLFRRADHLAAAMETRCYQGKGRTHRRFNRIQPLALLTSLAAAGAFVTIGVLL
ncbi:MAG: energy-coupling factor transporter transmembrane protein EcfT [Coriobacteriales bacterium]|jgi:energy-coupling factor transport system permease protein|nr:energy-coupling factor transporter transmembrane protein EcfT [Coriobacteriales bacterium]